MMQAYLFWLQNNAFSYIYFTILGQLLFLPPIFLALYFTRNIKKKLKRFMIAFFISSILSVLAHLLRIYPEIFSGLSGGFAGIGVFLETLFAVSVTIPIETSFILILLLWWHDVWFPNKDQNIAQQ